EATPVTVKRITKDQSFATEQILHKSGDVVLVRTSEATASDFHDLYVLEAGHMFALPDAVTQYGEVLEFVPAHFAVMRVGADQIAALSGEMHKQGSACGSLAKLDGEALIEPVATPTPVIPI